MESKKKKHQFLVDQALLLLEKLFTVKELQGCIIAENFRSPKIVHLLKNTDLAWKVALLGRAKSSRKKQEILDLIREVLTFICQH